jgi:hypothetical protein
MTRSATATIGIIPFSTAAFAKQAAPQTVDPPTRGS